MQKGKLITIKGIDGTGKSSIAKMLKTKLYEANFTTETLSWIGKDEELIRIKKDKGSND